MKTKLKITPLEFRIWSLEFDDVKKVKNYLEN